MGEAFDAYAVTTSNGPHVTLQAGVVHLGRYWTTTTRGSAKVAAIRHLGRAATTIGTGPWRVLGGRASVLDPARPWTFAAHPLASALLGGAVVRLGLGRLDQLLGYAEAGTAVPASFLPTGRVALVTRVSDELTLDGDEVTDAKGRWARQRALIEPGSTRPPRWNAQRAMSGIPDEVAELTERVRCGWLGVPTGVGSVALPAEWEPNTGRLRVSRDALAAVGAELPGPVCLTMDESTSRRPDEKLGVMLRGTGSVVDVDAVAASVALDVDRITYWDGFVATTKEDVAA
jgi:hypothetical protein